jgi:hypothetical protein
MTAQHGGCVVCVEHAGDRDAVAGIGGAWLGCAGGAAGVWLWRVPIPAGAVANRPAELGGAYAGAMPIPGAAAQMSDWMTAGGESMSIALAEHTGPWTADDVEALPDAGDHARFEVYEGGVLVVSPAPGAGHQRASYWLHRALAPRRPAPRARTPRCWKRLAWHCRVASSWCLASWSWPPGQLMRRLRGFRVRRCWPWWRLSPRPRC